VLTGFAFAGQFHNDAVLEYNTAGESLAGDLFAGSFGFGPQQSFVLENLTGLAVPQVEF
jgi:hypothetical protein